MSVATWWLVVSAQGKDGRKDWRCGVCFWQGRLPVISGCVWPRASTQHNEDQELWEAPGTMWSQKEQILTANPLRHNQPWSLVTSILVVHTKCSSSMTHMHTQVHRGIGSPQGQEGTWGVSSLQVHLLLESPFNSFWAVPFHYLDLHFVLLKWMSQTEH